MIDKKTILKYIEYIYNIETIPIEIQIHYVSPFRVLVGCHVKFNPAENTNNEITYRFEENEKTLKYLLTKAKKGEFKFFVPRIKTKIGKSIRNELKEALKEIVLKKIYILTDEIGKGIKIICEIQQTLQSLENEFKNETFKKIEKVFFSEWYPFVIFKVNVNDKLRTFYPRELVSYYIENKVDFSYYEEFFEFLKKVYDFVSFFLL